MAKKCVTEKTAQRQQWIENGLLELMQARKFEDITATDLCRHLSLSRRSFYRYFRDMEDVLDSLLNHTFQDFAMTNATVSIQDLQSNYEFWLQKRELLDALALSGLLSKITEYTLRYTDFDSPDKYVISCDLGMDIRREIHLFAVSGLVSLIVAWHSEGFQKTPEQMAQIAQQMLFYPILIKE